MGKVFITDEVNDMYTAGVTNADKLKVEDGAALYAQVSAYSTDAGYAIFEGPGYLKSIIIGEYPQTAAAFRMFDTYACASSVSGWGTSGTHVIGKIAYNVGAASGMVCGQANYGPRVIPMNVYLASGLSIVNASAQDSRIGAFKSLIFTYQT